MKPIRRACPERIRLFAEDGLLPPGLSCGIIYLSAVLVIFLGAFSMAGDGLKDRADPEGRTAIYERAEMVRTQLVRRGIREARVLKIMGRVPRHCFVPDSLRAEAYADGPLPIGFEQTISQPYIVAYMTELLELKPGDRVLEIGTGSGYQTAVLSELADWVFTVEIIEPLSQSARDTMQRLGYSRVEYKTGDGAQGWAEKGPFDKIIVTAAPAQIPQALVDQLKEGGRMIVPVGENTQKLILGIKKNGILETSDKIPVRFVPLVEAGGKNENKTDQGGL